MKFLTEGLAIFNAKKAELLEVYPELQDDLECLSDTLEGETDLSNRLLWCAKLVKEKEAAIDGLSEYISKLQERKTRALAQIENLRDVISQTMQAAEIEKLKDGAITLSLRERMIGAIVLDEELIPDEYKQIKKVVNKVALKNALTSGQVVLGATLSNGGKTIAIRV